VIPREGVESSLKVKIEIEAEEPSDPERGS
jgi:hypothetical protein